MCRPHNTTKKTLCLFHYPVTNFLKPPPPAVLAQTRHLQLHFHFLFSIYEKCAVGTEMITTREKKKPCTTYSLLQLAFLRYCRIFVIATKLCGSASLLPFSLQKSCASSKPSRGSSTNQNSVPSMKIEVSWCPPETNRKLL